MSSNYSSLERLLAKTLSKFPLAKQIIKRSYQRINFIVHKKSYRCHSTFLVSTIKTDENNFFGYYDKSPLSVDNRYLLYHSTKGTTKRKPDPLSPIEINVVDFKSGEKVWSDQSTAYNWQQGSRAQWLSRHKFIYNIYDSFAHCYQSRIIDLENNSAEILPVAVYDCFGEEFALTLNFERLRVLRPDYGYRNGKIMTDKELRRLDNDGVFLCELRTKESKLLISLETLRSVAPNEHMAFAYHKVNHIMISPDGGRFMFLHRYFVNKRRYDRLFVANREGNGLRLLSDNGMVSHCCWLDNHNIVGYLTGSLGDRYYRINATDGSMIPLGESIIDKFGDGHPSVKQGKMVFDTYPNKARMKQLFLYDMSTQSLQQLGEFYEALDYYGETRCDLHPRFSEDGGIVFFDSVHNGHRALYWVKLP